MMNRIMGFRNDSILHDSVLQSMRATEVSGHSFHEIAQRSFRTWGRTVGPGSDRGRTDGNSHVSGGVSVSYLEEYEVSVRIPEDKQKEFLEWMKAVQLQSVSVWTVFRMLMEPCRTRKKVS